MAYQILPIFLKNDINTICRHIEKQDQDSKEKIVSHALSLIAGPPQTPEDSDLLLKVWVILPESKIHSLDAIFDRAIEYQENFKPDPSLKKEDIVKLQKSVVERDVNEALKFFYEEFPRRAGYQEEIPKGVIEILFREKCLMKGRT